MVGVRIDRDIVGGQIVYNPDIPSKKYYVCETTGSLFSPCVTGGQIVSDKIEPNKLSGESLLQTHFEILYLN